MQTLEADRAASKAAKTAAQRERRRVSAAEARLVCLMFDLFVNPFCFCYPGRYYILFRVLVILFATSGSSPNRLLGSPPVALLILLLRSRRNTQSAVEFSAVALLTLLLRSRRSEPERS